MRRERVAGIDFERGGSGPPLLLVHGIGGERCVWEPLLPRLTSERDVIAVDLPGFGHSPPLPDGVSPSPSALAHALAGLLDALGLERVHAAGNSLGGWVALELAAADRALSVAGLCPAGLWGAPLDQEGAPAKAGAHRLARRLRPLITLLMLSRRARRLALRGVVGDPDLVPRAAARRMISSYARATAYEATSIAMRTSRFTAAERLRVPVLLAFGERDRMIRPVRLDVPGARSLMLPDCGHVPTWDAPELIAGLLLETSGDRAVPA
jgi:pimeloyl-ACP methyl ester carboxylesterase